MTRRSSGGSAIGTTPDLGRRRLPSKDRRAALIDAAALLVSEDGIESVSMEAVAGRAGVSRPLVYKHFANRDELLAAVFRREIADLDATIAAAVEDADGFEAKIRALIRALMEAVSTHGPILTPLLRAGGARDQRFRDEQRARDRRTVRFFARLAMTEFNLGKEEAAAAMAVLLSGMESIRAQARSRPAPEDRQFLEDIFVDLVVGGLSRIGARRPHLP